MSHDLETELPEFTGIPDQPHQAEPNSNEPVDFQLGKHVHDNYSSGESWSDDDNPIDDVYDITQMQL